MTITTNPAFAGVERREPFRQRGRTLLMVIFGIFGGVGVIGGIALAIVGAGDVAGAGMSFLFALIPLPLLWVSFWWLDRYEPEPRRYKFAAFVWGGVVAVAIALVLQIWIQSAYDVNDDSMASFVAPLTEEPAKCLFLLLTFARARRVIDGFLDGLIFAGLVGIGFAFVENIGYYAASYLGSEDIKIDGPAGVTTTFIVRGVFSPFAHPLFTSAFGIAIGLAVTRKSKFAKVALVLLGLALSIGLHGMWNASLSFGGGAGFLLVYLGLAVVLLLVATVAIVARSKQIRVLERSLSYVAQRGWIHPAEIPYLSRFTYRKAARRFAQEHHGKDARKVVKRYQQIATEMAFLHDAMMSGRSKPHGVERTYAMLDQMYALRPDLRFPPALQNTVRHF
ncbi:RsiW-degrading membrane proteinase PrsW (M82 family) [Aeromicrobium panaciterrae]|uniref:RsiW-degrading membrane proteinase PrsW (M82 family) n=1 Tax=Aeromicrobium panaciterrae TaxID=363861 RepID=A0ABU1UMT6_9ACTN|nr:PrsW family intramembrane metalloprotease [Aeromicrobium panaciterrae]MDR7086464.1 RsiW-degrading membrane proteinase PrsW (M82 family) [Aeromicrobium panaciterrae]